MLIINEGKEAVILEGEQGWLRYAIKTPVVTEQDELEDILKTYVLPEVQAQDIVFLSEKMVACTQARAIPLTMIIPSLTARVLSRFVTKTPRGIGLGMPETMQMAIEECGWLRILVASAAGALGRLLGQRGWFYLVAGSRASAIDGPCSYTLPPYDHCVVLSPDHPDQTAELCQRLLGVPVAIVDINDYGAEILGASKGLHRDRLCRLLRDNPLGQSCQQTPCGILRPVSEPLAGSDSFAITHESASAQPLDRE